MKFIPLLCLLGLACSKAVYKEGRDSKGTNGDLEVFPPQQPSPALVVAKNVKDGEADLDERLRGAFKNVLKKIKDALGEGKEIDQGLIDRVTELRQKLRDHNVDIGDGARKLLQMIKDRAQGKLDHLLDALQAANVKKRDVKNGEAESDERLRGAFKKVLKEIKDALGGGKEINQGLIDRITELRQKLRDHNVDMGDGARKLLQMIKDKAQGKLDHILDALKDTNVRKRDAEETELGERLKGAFKKVLKKLKDVLEEGKEVDQGLLDRLVELRQKLRDHNVDIGDGARKLLQMIKDHAKGTLDHILDALQHSNVSQGWA